MARHVLIRSEIVAGRRVLDLGCGSGLVAIAAAKGGAASVLAVDIDPHAVVATRLNAAANAVIVEALRADLLDGDPPEVDLILAGDVFYGRALARRVLPFLRRCRDRGVEVLVGDPGRGTLPLSRLREIARHDAADFGNGGRETSSGVYVLAG